MSFIEMPGLNDVEETIVAPEDRYSLYIKDVDDYVKEESENAGGNIVIKLLIAFDGHDEFQPFAHYLSMPGPHDDPEKAKTKFRMVKRFLRHVGLNFDDGFDPLELEGLRFDSNVRQEQQQNADGSPRFEDDGQPALRNVLSVPKFKD